MNFVSPSLLLWLLVFSTEARSQQPTLKDPLLDEMTGKWVLSGQIRGKQTIHDVDVDWALNHQYVHIHETSRDKNGDGHPQYEAEVFLGWDASKEQYVVHWMDVYGGGFSLTGFGKRDGSSIPIVFATGDDRFHTTFSFDEKNRTWRWTMDSDHQGKVTPFARLVMTSRNSPK
jgi:hypothetical protein